MPPPLDLVALMTKLTQIAHSDLAFVIIGHGQLIVKNTAVSLEPTTPSPRSRSVLIKSLGENSVPIFLGTQDVTTTNGYILEPGEVLSLDVRDVSQMYLRTHQGTAKVTWLVLGTGSP